MATTRFVTIDDLERDGTPEGLWELIDGELVDVNPTGEEHADITFKLILRLGSHVTTNRLGKLVMPDSGVVIPDRAQTVRSPDVGFIRGGRLPADRNRRGFFRVVPDLVVEVRSRGDTRAELMAKGMMWLDAGAELVWLIDPIAETVTELGRAGVPRELGRDHILDGGDTVPGFRMPVSELFSDLI
jgi:Uma2 family endonuclease